jgi:predicted transcriptional regulator
MYHAQKKAQVLGEMANASASEQYETLRKQGKSHEQIAEILGRSENSVSKYIKQRKLVATRLNGIYYISEASLLNFINNTKNAKS